MYIFMYMHSHRFLCAFVSQLETVWRPQFCRELAHFISLKKMSTEGFCSYAHQGSTRGWSTDSLAPQVFEPSHVANPASCRAVTAAYEFHLAQRRGTAPDPEPKQDTQERRDIAGVLPEFTKKGLGVNPYFRTFWWANFPSFSIHLFVKRIALCPHLCSLPSAMEYGLVPTSPSLPGALRSMV